MSNTKQYYKHKGKHPIPARLVNDRIVIEFGPCEDEHAPYFHLFTPYLPLALRNHENGVELMNPGLPKLSGTVVKLLTQIDGKLSEAVELKKGVEKLMGDLHGKSHDLGFELGKAGASLHQAAEVLAQAPELKDLEDKIVAERTAYQAAEEMARQIAVSFGFDPNTVGELAFEMRSFKDDDRVVFHGDVHKGHLRRLTTALKSGHDKAATSESIDLQALQHKLAPSQPVQLTRAPLTSMQSAKKLLCGWRLYAAVALAVIASSGVLYLVVR